jgi:hypothetical protein
MSASDLVSGQTQEQPSEAYQSIETLRRNSQFDEAYYRYLETIRHTKYTEELLQSLRSARISLAAKNALSLVVGGYFDDNAILSDIRDPEIPQINLDIALIMARLSYNRHDITVPELPQLENMIRIYFNNFILPRMTGAARERLISNTVNIKEERKILTGAAEPGSRTPTGILSRFKRE